MTNFYFAIGLSVDQMIVHKNKKTLQSFKFICGDTTFLKNFFIKGILMQN